MIIKSEYNECVLCEISVSSQPKILITKLFLPVTEKYCFLQHNSTLKQFYIRHVCISCVLVSPVVCKTKSYSKCTKPHSNPNQCKHGKLSGNPDGTTDPSLQRTTETVWNSKRVESWDFATATPLGKISDAAHVDPKSLSSFLISQDNFIVWYQNQGL